MQATDQPFKGESTRDRLLNAAESQFARRGYEATSLNEIAAAIGIRGPAVYKHFANKAALYEAVLERLFTPFKAMVSELQQAQTGAGQAVENSLQLMLRHHCQHPNIARLIQQATLAGGDQLELLTRHWYVPFFRALAPQSPLSITAIMAFHSLFLGYITLAPLHQQIFDTDPLAESSMRELLQLQQQLAVSILR